MNRTRDRHHRLAFQDQPLGFRRRRGPRIRQLFLNRDVAVQVLERPRIGDGRRQERAAFRTLPQFLYFDLAAGFRERLETAHHFIPIEYRPVGAYRMPETTRR